MAKQDVPCMFCGGLPCECSGTKKARTSKSTPKATSPAKEPSPSLSTENGTASSRFKLKDRDLSLESALRNIREIVCEEDRIAIDQELRYTDPPDVKQLEAEWRAKHGSKKSQ